MREVKVTDLRRNLPAYLAAVQGGEELRVVSRGKIIARIVPEQNDVDAAQARLRALRDKVQVGDVLTPIDVEWDAQR
jgi:prevent-host-death family protein